MNHVDLAKLIREASGGAAKLVSGKDAEELLANLAKEMDEGCGNADCPVHGSKDPKPEFSMEGVDLNNLTPEEALGFSIGAAAGAQWKLRRGRYDEAKGIQEQSFLWLQIREALLPGALDEVGRQLQARDRSIALLTDEVEALEEENRLLKNNEPKPSTGGEG